MFSGLFRTRDKCPDCGLKFEREPGYFLGSIYLNYGVTALVSTVTWTVLRFGYDLPARPVLAGLGFFCVLFPTLFFRPARALWLALDLHVQTAGQELGAPPPHSAGAAKPPSERPNQPPID